MITQLLIGFFIALFLYAIWDKYFKTRIIEGNEDDKNLSLTVGSNQAEIKNIRERINKFKDCCGQVQTNSELVAKLQMKINGLEQSLNNRAKKYK
jgi:hypothetical protein